MRSNSFHPVDAGAFLPTNSQSEALYGTNFFVYCSVLRENRFYIPYFKLQTLEQSRERFPSILMWRWEDKDFGARRNPLEDLVQWFSNHIPWSCRFYSLLVWVGKGKAESIGYQFHVPTSPASKTVLFFFNPHRKTFFYRFYKERKGERETLMWERSITQTRDRTCKCRYVPWLGIEPATFTGWRSNQLSHNSQGKDVPLFYS